MLFEVVENNDKVSELYHLNWITCSTTMINYHLIHKFKVTVKSEFNHLSIALDSLRFRLI